MIQTKFPDINKFYRRGGTSKEKLAQYPCVIIAGAVGINPNPILSEQVALADSVGKPHATYIIIDITAPATVESQIDAFLDLPGVLDSLTILDLESPRADGSVRCVNNTEALRARKRLEAKVSNEPWNYINPKHMQYLGYPDWLKDAPMWVAQWYWMNTAKEQFPDWDIFMAKYAGKLPASLRTGSGVKYAGNAVLWQFSCKGDARRLIANPTTNDPNNPQGIKDADLNVSLIEHADFMRLFAGTVTPPPPTPPTIETRLAKIETWAHNAFGYVP